MNREVADRKPLNDHHTFHAYVGIVCATSVWLCTAVSTMTVHNIHGNSFAQMTWSIYRTWNRTHLCSYFHYFFHEQHNSVGKFSLTLHIASWLSTNKHRTLHKLFGAYYLSVGDMGQLPHGRQTTQPSVDIARHVESNMCNSMGLCNKLFLVSSSRIRIYFCSIWLIQSDNP